MRSRFLLASALLALVVSLGLRQAPGPATNVHVYGSLQLAGSNPIAAARLPMNSANLPNPYWSNYAGVEGGIPSGSWTRCGSLISAYTGTAATINSAIAACGTNQYVELGSGTFTLSTGITFAGKSRVALRGQGPNSTFLIVNNTDSCLGQPAAICMQGNGLSYYVGEGTQPAHIVSWTAGYSNGSTQVTIANSSGLAVGQYFVLTQQNDGADTGEVYVCSSQYTGVAGTCSQQAGEGSVLGLNCNAANTCNAQHQWVKVVSCSPSCNNASSTVVSIDHPIHVVNWKSANTTRAYWGSSSSQIAEFVGVEELSVESRAHTANGGIIDMVYMANSWIKHVRMLYAPTPKAFVIMFGTSRSTIRDSYAFGTADESGSSTHYGVEEYGGNDNLVENNIWDHRTSPFVRDGTSGSVYGYNYSIDDYYDANGGGVADDPFLQADQYSHAAGNQMILMEGNISVSIKGDIVHGTNNLFTALRNYALGWDICTGCASGHKTTETTPINLYANSRYWNVVGNVFGVSGYHTVYENVNSDVSIYHVGGGMSVAVPPGLPVPSDSIVGSTLLRWGNYDVVTGAARFVNSEVPSSISVLPNPVPSDNSIPTSLYLSAKPSFMGTSDPWPGIGPDVTGGNVSGVGGHVYKNPAQRCYESMAVDPAYSTGTSGGRPRLFTCTYPLP